MVELEFSPNIQTEMLQIVTNFDSMDFDKSFNVFFEVVEVARKAIKCNSCGQIGLNSDGKTKQTWRLICKQKNCRKTISATEIIKFLPKNVLESAFKKIPVGDLLVAGKWSKLLPNLVNDDNLDESNLITNKKTKISKNGKLVNNSTNKTNISSTENYDYSIETINSNEKHYEPSTDNTTEHQTIQQIKISQTDSQNEFLLEEEILGLDKNTLLQYINGLHDKIRNLKTENKNLESIAQDMIYRSDSVKLKTKAVDPLMAMSDPIHLKTTTYASITNLHKPRTSLKSKLINKEFIPNEFLEEFFTKKPVQNSKHHSNLKLYFFDGCKRSFITLYRRLLQQKGFTSHLARDISFIAEEIIQIVTYESEGDNLIKAMSSISPQIKNLANFNPTIGSSYITWKENC